MTPERWQRVEEVFQAVLDGPRQARTQALGERCGGDDDLRGAVERLLADHDASGEAFESATWTSTPLKDAARRLQSGGPSRVGARLGAYRLERLAQWDPVKSRVIELRFFGGLSIEECADVMQVSVATVNRPWRMAKAWLHGELARGR